MAQLTCNLLLDVFESASGVVIKAKKGDAGSRRLCVRLTGCGEEIVIERKSVVALLVARGEEVKQFAGEILEDGRALFTIPAFALCEVGEVSCEVAVLGADGSRLTSASFVIEVQESLADGIETEFEEAEGVLLPWAGCVLSSPNVMSDGRTVIFTFQSNRVYHLNLDNSEYRMGDIWKDLKINLTPPDDPTRENKILIHGFSNTMNFGRSPSFQFGENCVFQDGERPYMTQDYFDLTLTYLPEQGVWLVHNVNFR